MALRFLGGYVAAFLTLGVYLLPKAAVAAPVAGCSLSVSSSPFLGESFSGTMVINNTGTGTGFVPGIELFLPQGITLDSASYLGSGLTLEEVGTFAGGLPLTNPYNGEDVSGPDDWTYVFVRLPLSGLPSSAPAASVPLGFSLNGLATLGTPVDVHGTCLFALGADAQDNPGSDAPIRSDDPTVDNDQLTSTVTPSVLTLSAAGTSPTVTGPNWPVTWTLTVDIADGETITSFDLSDTIDDRFIMTGISLSDPAAVLISPSTLPAAAPGGSVTISVGSMTGTSSGSDLQVSITGYIPELDGSGASIINPTTASPVTIPNFGQATNIIYDAPIDGPTALSDVTSNTMSTAAHAILVEERITNGDRSSSRHRPSETADFDVRVKVSDYFTFEDVSLTSTLDDGLTYDSGSPSNAPLSETGDDPTTLVFDHYGTLVGNEPGGTQRFLTYEAEVDEQYLAGDEVLGSDVIGTSQRLDSTVQGGGGQRLHRRIQL